MNKSKVEVFVEGGTDEKFFKDFLLHIKDELNIEVINVNIIEGKDKLFKAKPIFNTNEPLIKNILILDADNDFKKRTQEVNKVLEDLEFDVPFFLLPNNSDAGDLEILLENIIIEKNKELFECWDHYNSCLNSKGRNYTTPNRKAKIYAYLEALLPKNEEEKIRIGKRDYQNKNHWNLDSTYLTPLKTFLTNLK